MSLIPNQIRHTLRTHLVNPFRNQQTTTILLQTLTPRAYFTNADRIKKEDPYATLGLTWGATVTEIKDAYKRLARNLHPDVNTSDTPEIAVEKFQRVRFAYDKLVNAEGSHRDDISEEWSFGVWRGGDMISQKRVDVAGVMRKRPVKPATVEKRKWGVAALGHPSGRGNSYVKGEYLSDGRGPRSSTVGTGRNKWVKPKEFKPWNPDSDKFKTARDFQRESEDDFSKHR